MIGKFRMSSGRWQHPYRLNFVADPRFAASCNNPSPHFAIPLTSFEPNRPDSVWFEACTCDSVEDAATCGIGAMLDLVILIGSLAFFAIAIAYTHGCDKL